MTPAWPLPCGGFGFSKTAEAAGMANNRLPTVENLMTKTSHSGNPNTALWAQYKIA